MLLLQNSNNTLGKFPDKKLCRNLLPAQYEQHILSDPTSESQPGGQRAPQPWQTQPPLKVPSFWGQNSFEHQYEVDPALGNNPVHYQPCSDPRGVWHRAAYPAPAALPPLSSPRQCRDSAESPGARSVWGRCLFYPPTICCFIPCNLRASSAAAWAGPPCCRELCPGSGLLSH